MIIVVKRKIGRKVTIISEKKIGAARGNGGVITNIGKKKKKIYYTSYV